MVCAVCDTPTTDVCGGCRLEKYCNRECQRKDWPNHMSACKEVQLEKKIARAVDIAHVAYLTFRENTYDAPVLGLEEREDALVIYDRDIMDPQYFVDFPNDLASDKRTKLAMLCSYTCQEPNAYMLDVLLKSLKGSSVTIEELTVHFKHVPRKCIYIKPSGETNANFPQYFHEMIRLTSRKTGKQWAVDLSGGQYGICEPLHAWTEYTDKYLNEVTAQYAAGRSKALIRSFRQLPGFPSLNFGLVGEMVEALDEAVASWETQHMPLSRLVALPETEFKDRKANLLDALDTAVRTFMSAPEFVGKLRSKVRAAQAWERDNPGASVQNLQRLSGM